MNKSIEDLLFVQQTMIQKLQQQIGHIEHLLQDVQEKYNVQAPIHLVIDEVVTFTHATHKLEIKPAFVTKPMVFIDSTLASKIRVASVERNFVTLHTSCYPVDLRIRLFLVSAALAL